MVVVVVVEVIVVVSNSSSRSSSSSIYVQDEHKQEHVSTNLLQIASISGQIATLSRLYAGLGPHEGIKHRVGGVG